MTNFFFSPDVRPKRPLPDIPLIETEVIDAFKKIYVETPMAAAVHRRIDVLRDLKARGDRFSAGGIATLFAPSFAGKSECLKQYVKTRGAGDPDDPSHCPVFLFEFKPSITGAAGIAGSGLMAMKDPPTLMGRKPSLDRFFGLLATKRAEVSLADEVGNVQTASKDMDFEKVTQAHNAFRFVADMGMPILYTGTTDTRHRLGSEEQMMNRIIEVQPLFFGPLELSNTEHVTIYIDFLIELDVQMRKLGLFNERTCIADEKVCPRLMLASDGLIGKTVKLVTIATILAFNRGSNLLTPDLLAAAVDVDIARYKEDPKRTQKITRTNPFRDRDGKLLN